MSPSSMVLPAERLLFQLCLLALPLSAAGVEFSAPTLRSALGEPLDVEIEVRAEAGERLVPQCFRSFAPRSRDLPAPVGAHLRYEGDEERGRLQVATSAAVTEPALQLGIETTCGGSRAWRELPLLLKPSPSAANGPVRMLSGGEWVIVPGESPASMARLLYPGQPGVQRRFVAALIAGNPAVDIDPSGTRELPVGTVLRMPDWRALGSVAGGERPISGERARSPQVSASPSPASEMTRSGPAPMAGARKVVVPPAATGALRLSTSLAERPAADERLREMLRLEYRLLQSLASQMSASGSALAADAGSLERLPEPRVPTGSAPPAQASALLPAPSVPSQAPAVATPSAVAPPVHLRQSPPEPSAGRSGGLIDWLPYIAAGGFSGFAMIAFGLYRARRHHRSAKETLSLSHAETIVLDMPAARPPASAEAPEAVQATAAAPKAVPAAVPMPSEISPTDVNPVMELAEIMLSFGRLEGAAQTLQEYIEANPKETLKPWMKLLDIYREGNMPAEFDALADKLHRNFNVECQRWDGSVPPPVSPRQIGRAMSLDEFPHICEQLVALWGTPACLDYLHKLLRDNRGGERNGFTLPVVQEILFLIDIHVGREAAT